MNKSVRGEANGDIENKPAEFEKPTEVRLLQPVTALIRWFPIEQIGTRGAEYSALND